MNCLSTWSTQVNLYIFSRCWGWILSAPLSDPCDRYVTEHRHLIYVTLHFFNLTLTLLRGTSEVEEQVLYLNPFLEHCCQSVKKLQPAGRKECVCHISPILITCAHQALSESLTKVFPRLQTQLRRFRHSTFSSCHAEPQMPSACLKWFWTRVLMARTVACEKHQSNDFSFLSTTRPVDIRHLREMKIGCVWLSWRTGRSWKTSDLITSVHQRAAFRFLSINLQASALGWSELFCLEGFEMQYFQKFKIPRLFGYFVWQLSIITGIL